MCAAKRVDGFVFPHIYSRFKAKDKNNENIVEYRIQDLPEDKYQDAVKLFKKSYLRDEPVLSCKKIWEDEIAMKNLNNMIDEYLAHKVSTACFKENSDEIVAFNMMKVMKKENHFRQPKSESAVWNDLMDTNYVLEDLCNVFEHYNVTEALFSFGLIVHPDYRKRGIATEMLKARKPLMESLNIKLTSTTFSAPGSQSAAAKAGFEENVVIPFKDLHKYQPGLYYHGIKSKVIKQMSLKI